MNRITPLDWDEMSELHEFLDPVKERMGFIPTSQRVMARRPKILKAFVGLTRAVYDPEGETPLQLRALVSLAASLAAGCMYCQAHTSSNANRAGLPVEERKFSPHITLARLKGAPAQRLLRYVGENADFLAGPIPVDRFVLFSSFLSSSGAIYTPEASYDLDTA